MTNSTGIVGLTFMAVTANMIGTGAGGAGHVIAVGMRGDTDPDLDSIPLRYIASYSIELS